MVPGSRLGNEIVQKSGQCPEGACCGAFPVCTCENADGVQGVTSFEGGTLGWLCTMMLKGVAQT